MGKYFSDTTAPGKEFIQILELHFLIHKLNIEVGEIRPLNDFLHHSPGDIRMNKKKNVRSATPC